MLRVLFRFIRLVISIPLFLVGGMLYQIALKLTKDKILIIRFESDFNSNYIKRFLYGH